MAPSPASGSHHDNAKSDIPPFYVIRSSCGSERRTNTKTRRKIELSGKVDSNENFSIDDDLNKLKADAFNCVWAKIDSSIKDVLRNANEDIFDVLYQWISRSFQKIRLHGKPDFAKATQPYPTILDASLKRVFTGFVLTKNLESVDDLLSFEYLGLFLKSSGCHVANLSSLDLSPKSGIGGCLRSLLRQFLKFTPVVADMSILASWYNELRDDKPIVIIVEELERCAGAVLPDLILMLSEWMVKIPVILIMGVATTLDTPRNILPCDALQLLCSSEFILGSPTKKMDAIVEAVMLKTDSCLSVSHGVSLFMRDYFQKHDGTLASFIRALKVVCVQHFSKEHLSILLEKDITEDAEELQCILARNHLYPPDMLKRAFQFPSSKIMGEPTVETLARGLISLKKSLRNWRTVVLCLHEAGKRLNIPLLDLCSEALDPHVHERTAEFFSRREVGQGSDDHASCISRIVRGIRYLPPSGLRTLLDGWKKYAEDVPQMHDKVTELQSMLTQQGESRKIRGQRPQNSKDTTQDALACSDKAAGLTEWMLRNLMIPIECMPFHEISCYRDVDRLKWALVGDPRRMVQSDLLGSSKPMYGHGRGQGTSIPSLHDTSIMYRLGQEHGDLINIHDWYESFKSTVSCPTNNRKSRPKSSPSPKKRRKDSSVADSNCHSEVALQARFCRVVTELQILGLLRMPSKRRPDYLQRAVFGL